MATETQNSNSEQDYHLQLKTDPKTVNTPEGMNIIGKRIIKFILWQIIEGPFGRSDAGYSIGEYVYMASMDDKSSIGNTVLRRYGLKVQGGYLFISTCAPYIINLLDEWFPRKDWHALVHLKGASKVLNESFSSYIVSEAYKIPLESLIEEF